MDSVANMKNRLKQMLDSGEPAIGAQLRFGSPAIAELFGAAGFDFVVIDSEHSPQTPSGIQEQMQAAQASGATPLVRVGTPKPDPIGLLLDMGAMGIISPMVSTAEQASLGSMACMYPPSGTRGFGPSRASAYGFDEEYFKQANDNILYIPIIETVQAVSDIDDILTVRGVDAYVIGLADLSISLGSPLEFNHPDVKAAVSRITEAGVKAGVSKTIALDYDEIPPDQIRELIEDGTSLFLVDGDEWMLSASCAKVVNNFRLGKSGA